jgi:hypothetical protein
LPGTPDPGDVVAATSAYEAWLETHLSLIPEDLERKHASMASGLFPFLRATFYLWIQRWPRVCPELARAPRVRAVGDLHVENFGTWRDQEGRLIWGINDFDEAWRLPYTNDLLRLATSVLAADEEHDLEIARVPAIKALLEGYRDSLDAGGRPFVLAEHHEVLGEMAAARLHEPTAFWRKLAGLPTVAGKVSLEARRVIRSALPRGTTDIRLVHRTSGLGSLGRERVVGIGECEGGLVAREAKALGPSAAARGARHSHRRTWLGYRETVRHAVRCPDPSLRVLRHWIIRRLAPDCCRLELAALPRKRDERELLYAMGWETANVHLGTERAGKLEADLDRRPKGWLLRAAQKLCDVVRADWEAWRAHTSMP